MAILSKIKDKIMDIGQIQGWLYREEGKLLEKLASDARVAIVEIGSWKGKSTVWLARKSSVKVYTIDPHTDTNVHIWQNVENTYDEFIKNMKKYKVENTVIPLVMTSQEAHLKYPSLKCDLVFVDGDHRYEFIKLDIELWSKHLVRGGIMAIHDVQNPDLEEFEINGPVRAWDDFIVGNDNFEILGFVRTMGYARKVKE